MLWEETGRIPGLVREADVLGGGAVVGCVI